MNAFKFITSILEGLPELTLLEHLCEMAAKRHGRVEQLGVVRHHDKSFPLMSISFGSKDPAAPCLGFFGGVHGIERIGAQVVLAYLNSVVELLEWDEVLTNVLKKSRLVFMPLVNPVGMLLRQRSNENGVDLMRNAPVEAANVHPLFLTAGHHISPHLPWYRGKKDGPMEPESQAIDEFVRDQMFASEMAISVDVHSGYGVVDRLWFPYAKTKDPFPDVGEMWALKSLLDKTYPNHVYRIEPQSEEYCTHGDLWDYLYDEYRAHTRSHKRLYLPLSLELGSWAWVKKNPVQAFSLLGFFNPLKPHRLQRQLRRHIPLFDFLLRAVHSADKWRPQTEAEQKRSRRHAVKFWFRS